MGKTRRRVSPRLEKIRVSEVTPLRGGDIYAIAFGSVAVLLGLQALPRPPKMGR